MANIKKDSDKPSSKKNTNKKAITIKKDLKPKKEVKTSLPINNKPVILKKDVKEKKVKKKKAGKILNIILSIIMFLGICIMLIIMSFGTYIVLSAPPFEADKLYSQEASIILDKNGEEFARVGTQKRETKTYQELPQTFVDALVATEDSRFFQHNGFDVIRFIKASLGQLAGNSGAGGASTLTMQVAKNTFSKKEDGTVESRGIEGIVRKFTDIYMSIFLIERNYTKEEIIEFYANSLELGYNSFGVEQASQTYFGKSISDLSLTESALLVGLFNGPSYYDPYYHADRADYRRAIVLDLMVRHGYIDEAQADDAKAIPISSLLVDAEIEELNEYQQFLDIVLDEVKEKTGLSPYTTPMIVYTTLDREIQSYMKKLNNGELDYKWKTYKYNDYKDIVDIGIVITDVHDGSISAVNGGRKRTGARVWSNATYITRSPGSTIKPFFDYGPYIEYNNGNPSTLFFDNKMTFSNGQSLRNSDDTYAGQITMRQALAQSRNIPAVQAFQAVDKNKITEFVHNVGLDYCKYDNNGNAVDCNLYEAMAIGGGLGFSPKTMAAAYGTLARGGYYIEPYSVTKIIYRETEEPVEFKYEKTQAMSEETAYMLTDMLVTATSQGIASNFKVPGTQIATKTGTATYDSAILKKYNIPNSASSDNWIISYSPDYVISCWYGVDVPGHKVYTDSLAGAIENKRIMAQLGNRIFKKNSKFSKPSGVISAQYEIETFPAQKPSAYTPANLISSELFKKGTEPSGVSDRFEQLLNPTNGSAEVTGTQINLSWKEINEPNSINNSYLVNYFKSNYGQFADMYLNKRYNYNESTLGTLGYRVYLENNGNLQFLGFTSNPNYVYNSTTTGTHNFIIKSSYSIFTSNMSSGLTIKTEIKNEIPIIPEPDDPVEKPDVPPNETS